MPKTIIQSGEMFTNIRTHHVVKRRRRRVEETQIWDCIHKKRERQAPRGEAI